MRNRLLELYFSPLMSIRVPALAPRQCKRDLPPQLLDPAWQWPFSGALIDNAPLSAVGLGQFHQASNFDPDDAKLQRRSHGLHRWAAAPATLLLRF